MLAKVEDADRLPDQLPALVELLRARLAELRSGRIPLDDLLVGQRLTRDLEKYTVPSPAARAAAQLAAVGKHVRPGQRVRFLLLRGQPDVHAWDLPELPDPERLDLSRYRELLMRAASSVTQPLGVDQPTLEAWVEGAVPMELIRSVELSQPCMPR